MLKCIGNDSERKQRDTAYGMIWQYETSISRTGCKIHLYCNIYMVSKEFTEATSAKKYFVAVIYILRQILL